jgi:hypothetical protein
MPDQKTDTTQREKDTQKDAKNEEEETHTHTHQPRRAGRHEAQTHPQTHGTTQDKTKQVGMPPLKEKEKLRNTFYNHLQKMHKQKHLTRRTISKTIRNAWISICTARCSIMCYG